jgi:hypothetical protein
MSFEASRAALRYGLSAGEAWLAGDGAPLLRQVALTAVA